MSCIFLARHATVLSHAETDDNFVSTSNEFFFIRNINQPPLIINTFVDKQKTIKQTVLVIRIDQIILS
jgi:hypothetical protein